MPLPKHLKMGDEFPPTTPNKLRLYSMRYCPYALRARLMLAKHGVEHEVINIALSKDKPEWFLDKYPVGTVPVLETGGKILGGSLVVAEYVEEVFGNGKRTLFTDPWKKGETKMLIDDKFSKAISAVYKRLMKKENWEESFFKDVGELEKTLQSSKFFVGDKITFADYMIWPWMRLVGPVIDDVLQSRKFKNLESWIEDMSEDEIVKECYTSPDVLREFCKAYETGVIKYDLE